MKPVLVSGLTNLETTLRVDRFPLDYSPVNFPFFGISSTISGVGLNISLALASLGDEPNFLSIIGGDMAGRLALDEISRQGIDTSYVLPLMASTAQSVILYDGTGQRQIHVDLKDIQECVYPAEIYTAELREVRLAVLCNINFSRPMLAAARRIGLPVAIDVHTIDSLDDPYNADFMNAADILFMSHERLPVGPETWMMQVFERCPCQIIGIGMGAKGALLAERGQRPRIYPAAAPRPVVNTIGAGDALFASFLHYYSKWGDPDAAMRRAIQFAGYKTGSAGAAEGFLNEDEVEQLLNKAPS